jgi:hypothetical protein
MKEEQDSGSGFLYLWVLAAIVVIIFGCTHCNFGVRVLPNTPKATEQVCESGTLVKEEGGQAVCQPVENGKPAGSLTFLKMFHFGAGKDYATALQAAQTAQKELGKRSAYVYCDELHWKTDLDYLVAELQKDTIFGISKDTFCLNGGDIEVLPAE